MAQSRAGQDASLKQQTKKKLKDSCNSCAASKVKCDRKKPTCSRCEDHEQDCHYSLSQRSGRWPTTSQATAAAQSDMRSCQCSQETSVDDSTSKWQRPSPQGQLHPLSVQEDVSIQYQARALSFDPDLFNSFDMNTLMSFDSLPDTDLKTKTMAPSAVVTDAPYITYFPDLLNNSPSTWIDDATHLDPLSIETSVNSSASSTFFDTTSLSLPAPCLQQAFDDNSSTSQSSSAWNVPCCFMRTAEVLNRLRGDKSTCCFAESSKLSSMTDHTLGFTDIMNSNKECMTILMSILNCPCSQEQQIVFMISMIIFEVLERYRTAALDNSELSAEALERARASGKSLAYSKYKVVGPESQYMRTALTLGELYRVVQLLERLSSHSCNVGDNDLLKQGRSGSNLIFHNTPIPASVFTQVEADMRKHLTDVRDQLIEVVRNATSQMILAAPAQAYKVDRTCSPPLPRSTGCSTTHISRALQ